jgi:regulator of sirC expression with transglutaminase-like and TPR domain
METRQEIARSKGKNPNDPGVCCPSFCGAMIKLGFAYREQFAQKDLTPTQMKNPYADADNVFLTGLLRTMRGSCVSMPLVYLVIGQRLGLPVHLVHIGKHFFVRWQEPSYRIDIETTAVDHVWVTDDDSVYVEEEGMKPDDVKGNDLRNLSNQEVIACLLFTRSCHLAMKVDRDPVGSWSDLSRAFSLSPADPAIGRTYSALKPQKPAVYVSHHQQPRTNQLERNLP